MPEGGDAVSALDPMEIDRCFDQYELHKKTCRHCGTWSHCSIGLGLLRQAAKDAEARLGAVMKPKAKA